MLFSGGRRWSLETSMTELFFACQSPEDSSGAVYESGSTHNIGYPLAFDATNFTLLLNVSQNTLNQDATVRLSQNGVHVYALTVTAGFTGGIAGGNDLAMFANDLMDISVELNPSTTEGRILAVAATLVILP